MKASTVYSLIGCAGLGLTVGGSAWTYSEYSAWSDRKDSAVNEFQESVRTKSDLSDKLEDCFAYDPATAECRAAYHNSVTARGKYDLVKSQLQKIDDNKPYLLTMVLMMVGGIVTVAGFKAASVERKDEKQREEFKVYAGRSLAKLKNIDLKGEQ